MNKTNEDHDELLTIPDVQRTIHKGKEFVYNLIMSGELPTVVIGGRRSNGRASRRVVRRSAVLALIEKWEQQTADELAAGRPA